MNRRTSALLKRWPNSHGQVRFLRGFILLATIGAGLIVVADALSGFSRNFLISVAIFAGFCSFGLISLVPGFYAVTAIGLPLVVVVLISVNFLVGGGIHDPASPIYLVTILLAAFFLGKKGALGFTILALVASSTVIVLNVLGMVPTTHPSTWGTLVTFVIVTGLGGVLVWLLLSQLEHAIASERASASEVRVLNEALERRVKQRTQALSEVQEQFILNEKLAALGRVAANLSHEINNPLGAIVSGSASIRHAFRHFQERFDQLLALGDPASLSLLRKLASAPQTSHSTMTRVDRRSVISELEAWGIADVTALANCLEELGFEDFTLALEGVHDNATFRAAEAAILVAYEIRVIDDLAAIVDEAAGRVHKIVDALTTNAESSRQLEEFTAIDLRASIELAMNLMTMRNKEGVTVSLDCPQGGELWGQRGSLFQVWTYLMRNAVDSMPKSGKIDIRCHWEETPGAWMIEFEDSGTTVISEHRDVKYSPFFTTKVLAPGSELGLDVIKRIIAEHSGTLSFETQPGRRVFRLVIPKGG